MNVNLIAKKVGIVVALIILSTWFVAQCSPHESVAHSNSATESQEAAQDRLVSNGYERMIAFYHASLTEPKTCATSKYPIGTNVQIKHEYPDGSSNQCTAVVVSNVVHVDTVGTVEVSEDVNDCFCGANYTYTVYVKEV